jgi:hypothetical protein
MGVQESGAEAAVTRTANAGIDPELASARLWCAYDAAHWPSAPETLVVSSFLSTLCPLNGAVSVCASPLTLRARSVP